MFERDCGTVLFYRPFWGFYSRTLLPGLRPRFYSIGPLGPTLFARHRPRSFYLRRILSPLRGFPILAPITRPAAFALLYRPVGPKRR